MSGSRLLALALVLVAATEGAAADLAGRVRAEDGGAPAGAIVTVRDPARGRDVSVYADDDGRFRVRGLHPGPHHLRVRAYGFADAERTTSLGERGGEPITVTLVRETDPQALAWQLPANRWLALVLDRLPDAPAREEFVRQCTYCHQQGDWATRVPREEAEWRKLLALMARMGGVLSAPLRAELPAILNAAWDEASYVPALGERFDPPPPPSAAARRAVITQWAVGSAASMPHDVAVAPDGTVWAVDMTQDLLHRLDVATDALRAFAIPGGGLPLGGVFATRQPVPANASAHVGPHSLQIAPDGGVWITLALGNRLARFDPVRETFQIWEQPVGLYPHTLRFDGAGRIWYTLAVSNHIGRFDPATGERRTYRLPARTWGQAIAVRVVPFVLWLGRLVDLDPEAAGDGPQLPVPYGIDIAPDGGVWFAQLNERRIGRLDPETGAVRMVDTPFPAPRRLRFDADGRLWIPSFSSGTIARFDPATEIFETWPLPTRPAGTETPYALNVDRRTGAVWVCGTQSDTLIRFEPAREAFTVYPLPGRVTYTREIDFDAGGAVWTCNSNLPAWHIEGSRPTLIRLEPDGSPAAPGDLALPLVERDEPAGLVHDLTDEDADLRVRAGEPVDAVGGPQQAERRQKEGDVDQEPPPIRAHDLAFVLRHGSAPPP